MLKGNTLAIALGALLVGGVATAGFINNQQGAGQPTGVDAADRAVGFEAAPALVGSPGTELEFAL